MASSLVLGTYTFDPVPTISISKNWVRTQSGCPLNIIYSATLTGTLIDVNKTNRDSPINLLKDLQDELCNCDTCTNMLLKCDDNTTILDANVRILSIEFAESSDSWVETIPFTLVVEWDSGEHTGTGDANCDSCIRSVSDIWSWEQLETPAQYNIDSIAAAWAPATVYNIGDTVESNGNTYEATVGGTSGAPAPNHTSGTAVDGGGVEWLFISVGCDVGPQFLQFSHNVEVQAVDCCDDATDLLVEGYEVAKTYIENQALLGWDGALFDGIYGFGFNTQNDWSICEHTRTGNLDKKGGSYSVIETFVVSTQPTSCCFDDWTVECEESTQSRLNTYSISGTIRGMETRDFSNNTLTTSKIENAKACWDIIRPTLASRIECCCGPGATDCPINPIPLSNTVGFSPTAGSVTYSYTFDNRPLSVIEGALSESITISDTKPQETIIEIPIPGRPMGPILKSCFSQPSKRKSLSIQAVMPFDCTLADAAVTNCIRFNELQLTAAQGIAVDAFVCCIEEQLLADNTNGFVARTVDNCSLSIPDGIYSRSVEWVYQNCDMELPVPCDQQ